MPLELDALELELELLELLDASADELEEEAPPPPPSPPELADEESALLEVVVSVPDEASAELLSPLDAFALVDEAVVSSGMSSWSTDAISSQPATIDAKASPEPRSSQKLLRSIPNDSSIRISR